MRRGWWLLAVLSGCVWTAYEPAPRMPFDARLGIEVMRGHPLLSANVTVSSTGSLAVLNVVQPRGRQRDLVTIADEKSQLYTVDFDTGVVRRLPDSPLGTRQPTFGTAWTVGHIVLLGNTSQSIAYWDGTAWTNIPPPPGDEPIVSVSALDTSHVVVRRTRSVLAWDGAGWSAAPYRGVLGPLDSLGFRQIFPEPGSMCTELMSWRSPSPIGPKSCTSNVQDEPRAEADNGRVDDFQILSGDAVFHFKLGTWTRGVSVTRGARLAIMPGSLRVAVNNELVGQGLFPSHVWVTGGALAGLATPQLKVALSCTCSRRDDPSCGCIERAFEPNMAFLQDGSGLISVGVDTVDAERRVFARRLALPIVEAPYGAACARSCPTNERCEVQVGNSGFVSDACVSNDAMTMAPAGRLSATVVSPNPGSILVALASSDGGTTDARVVSAPPMLIVEGPPLQPVRVTLTQAGHAPRVMELTFPDAARTAELGTVPLVAATFVDTVPSPSSLLVGAWGTVVNSAQALLLPALVADGGLEWTALRSAADGGLIRTSLAPARKGMQNTLVTPLWFPRQGRVLVPGPTSLAAFDDVTLQPRGVLAGGDFVDGRFGFSAGSQGDVVLVPRDMGASFVRVDAMGLTRVVNLSGSAATGSLAGDGGVVVRQTGNWVAQFTDGSSRTLSTILASTQVFLEGSGRAVFFNRDSTLIEVTLSTGAERVITQGAGLLAPGLKSDRLVASGSTLDGGLFTPFTSLFASGLEQGPFGSPSGGRLAAPGVWASQENSSQVLRLIDDGSTVATLPGSAWRFVALSDLGFAAFPVDAMRSVDVRYFRDGVLDATLALSTVGAPFGTGDTRLASGRQVHVYASATGAQSNSRFIVPQETAYTWDPPFNSLVAVSPFATTRTPSTRGMPCALFSTPHLAWSVAPSGTVTPLLGKTDFFCAQ